MNKQQAADFLDVTTRAVERYVERGRLTARYVKGKTGKIADFDEAELRALKEELDQPPNIIRPAVQRRSPDNHDGSDWRESPERSEALVHSDLSGLSASVGADRLIAALEAIAARDHMPVLTLADKLVLNLKEVSQLTGRSVARLRADCESGRLKAKKNEIARGWRIKRDDLDAYVKKL